MPDITMCTGIDCNKKDKCYRFLATPNEQWQSYFSSVCFPCDYFWPIKDAINAGRIGYRDESSTRQNSLSRN